jgi:ankyrin repeat protein
MSKSLPPRPNLEHLKHQAKDLLKSHQSGDSPSLLRIQQSHPRFEKVSEAEIRAAKFSLSDAQLVIAREYGFANWPKLKERVDGIALENIPPAELFQKALREDDASLFRKVIARHPELKAKINEPMAAFDAPLINSVRSREMLEALLDAGADINAKSKWWAGGFGLLHLAKPDLAAYAIERGASVDVHAAARLGMINRLSELIAAKPRLVHERGGDGQTPLHFAGTIEVAKFLLDRGAEINARDVDHESTPVQYMVRDRQEVARFLVERGADTDLLLVSALGDAILVRRHLDADPDCIHMRVSDDYFPKKNPRSGGTIYQWTLGWQVSAHDVARQFGHEDIYRLLMERSPASVKLIAACWAGDEAAVKLLLAQNAGLIDRLSNAECRQIANAARSNSLIAVRLMMAAGLPVNATGQHGATPLHWAAWHGNVSMVREILAHHPALETRDSDFGGTPLNWAIHASKNGWDPQKGDYVATLEALIEAGATLPVELGGTDAVKDVLRRNGVKD